MNNFFSKELDWIGNRIREDTKTFPESIKPLAEQYISKRLIYSADEDGYIRIDPRSGLPTRNFIPQVVFWIADAFGLRDNETSRRLAIGLVYSSLAFAVIDDIIEETQSPPSNLALANMYLHKYIESFEGMFEQDSRFWQFLVESIKNFTLHVYRDFLSIHEPKDKNDLAPLSELFLFESCKSYSALVMTTFVAVAYLTDNESKIPRLTKFWRNYATGHRIYDDLNDIFKDIRMRNYNNSSILIYALQSSNKSKINEELVCSMLLDSEFIEKIYNTMLGLFRRAKEDASVINSPYLNNFMDELINTHTKKRDKLLQIRSNFYDKLEKIIIKALHP
jgi:hypothetical protein